MSSLRTFIWWIQSTRRKLVDAITVAFLPPPRFA